MCWDVDIFNRPDVELIDADYWSRLGADLNFDPLYRNYLELTHQTRKHTLLPRIYPCARKICLTTVVHGYRSLPLRLIKPIRLISRAYFLT